MRLQFTQILRSSSQHCFVCKMIAASHGVHAMPTFQFFLNGMKVDEIKGADPSALETKTKQWSIQSTFAVSIYNLQSINI